MQGKSWYFSRNGRVEGPFTQEQVKQRVTINDNFLVWNPSLAKWQAAEILFSSREKQGHAKSVSGAAQKNPNVPSSSANRIQVKAEAAKVMKQFAQRWRNLEQKHSDERRDLLTQIIAEQDAVMSSVSDAVKKIGRANTVENIKANKAAKARKKAQVKSPEITASQLIVNEETERREQDWLKEQMRKPNVHCFHQAKEKAKEMMNWPADDVEPEITADDLALPSGKNTASKMLSGDSYADKQVSEAEEHQAMLRRVTRRRRRRSR